MPGGTSIDPSVCTPEICPIEEYGLLDYYPSIAGNALYLAIFGAILLPQVYIGLRHRTWGYLFGMTGGLVLEILGYMSRILLHDNIYSLSFFVMNICCLTLGPAFFSAAIYVCLSRIINIYGEEFSPLRPQIITVLFVACDLLAMSLQAVGGALTSAADTEILADQGVDIMIAGLTFQVATTVAFCVVCITLFFRVRNNPIKVKKDTASFRATRSFRLFLTTITIATVTILIRCCYRLAELSQGYESSLANDEVSFMILEGAMMIICVVALTIGHPGPILGHLWSLGQFQFSSIIKRQAGPARPEMIMRKSDISGSDTENEKTTVAEAVHGSKGQLDPTLAV